MLPVCVCVFFTGIYGAGSGRLSVGGASGGSDFNTAPDLSAAGLTEEELITLNTRDLNKRLKVVRTQFFFKGLCHEKMYIFFLQGLSITQQTVPRYITKYT
jgi:hypothetical protein